MTESSISFLLRKRESLQSEIVTELDCRSAYQGDFTLYFTKSEVITTMSRCPKSVSNYRVNPLRVNGRFIKAEYGFTLEQLKDPEFCLEHELEAHAPRTAGNLLCDDLDAIVTKNKKIFELLATVEYLAGKRI